MDEQWLQAEEKRTVLRRVAAYRELCNRVRRSAMSTFIFGLFMFGIWYMLDGQINNFNLISLSFLGLAVLEISVGVLNRIWPSAEGVLLEGIVLIAFGATSLLRQYLIMKLRGAGNPNPIFVLFGLYWIYQGFQHVRSYNILRKEFAERPTSDHIRWFDSLIREIRTSNPEDDAQALVLPTKPRMAAKLLGDTAIFLFPSGEVMIVSQEEVFIAAEIIDPDKPFKAYIQISGFEFKPFPMSESNWQNYARWKQENGEPVPPPQLRIQRDVI